MVNEIINRELGDGNQNSARIEGDKAKTRLSTIDRIITKLYTDNAKGTLDDNRLRIMVADLEREANSLNSLVSELDRPNPAADIEEKYARFFEAAKSYTHIDKLDREILTTFVDRIEIVPKFLPDGKKLASHRNSPYRQSVRIFYKLIGELDREPVRELGAAASE